MNCKTGNLNNLQLSDIAQLKLLARDVKETDPAIHSILSSEEFSNHLSGLIKKHEEEREALSNKENTSAEEIIEFLKKESHLHLVLSFTQTIAGRGVFNQEINLAGQKTKPNETSMEALIKKLSSEEFDKQINSADFREGGNYADAASMFERV